MSARPHTPRWNAFSIPEKSDQSSAPRERMAGGIRYFAQRPMGSVSAAAAIRKPIVARQATIAAHTISDRSRNPTRYPIASTKGYAMLVFPLENPFPSDH